MSTLFELQTSSVTAEWDFLTLFSSMGAFGMLVIFWTKLQFVEDDWDFGTNQEFHI